jgi:hypothetical protein
MASRIWQEVSAEEIIVGDVLQWGTDGRVRVVDVHHRWADDRILEPVCVISVAGPTDRFERNAGIRTGMTVRPLDKVTRMDPNRAAEVANTNLRTVMKSDARREAEIRALEGRQSLLMAQIMDETRDRRNDVSDPIAAYSALAAELAPLYIARKANLRRAARDAAPKPAPETAPARRAEPAKHTCNGGQGPHFGRKTAGCPRCDELLAGAEPRQGWTHRGRFSGPVTDAERTADIRAHFAGERHRSDGCGPVCTYGDW